MIEAGHARKPGFQGIHPMQYAFFDAEGRLDRGAMLRQLEGCLANGVDGIAILGLGTEVNKFTLAERLQVLEWSAEGIAGRVPLCVTVAEPSAPAQIAFARTAAGLGADWIILQPPPVRSSTEIELIRFFGQVADAVDLPIGVQNAPEYIGIGLSPAGIATLARQHENFTVLKGEGAVLGVRAIIEATEGRLSVFNGRGGLELIDNLRAGCAGMVPGAESCDIQKRIYDLTMSADIADHAEAQRVYQSALPLIVFLMQSLDNLLCYGKRLAAQRYGIETVYDRGPSLAPTEFGLSCLRRATAQLWPNLPINRLN